MDKITFVIRQYEKIAKEKIFSIRPLDDEHPNIYLLNYSVVVRANEPVSCELFYRRRMGEYYFYQKAVSEHMPLPCPFIHFYIPRGSIKAEASFDGKTYDDELSEEEAFKVIDAIASLHQFKFDKATFDPFEHFYHYKKLAPNALPSGFEEGLVKKMRMLYDSSPKVLSHNDIKRRHVLIGEKEAVLLDYKDVGENAPIFDLASFFLDSDLSPDMIRACLARYQKATNGLVYLYQDVFDAMSFVCAYDYYHYAALSKTNNRALFAEEAKKRKERCLRLFEESLG